MLATNVSGKEMNETLATNQIVASPFEMNVEVSVEKQLTIEGHIKQHCGCLMKCDKMHITNRHM